MPHRQKHFVEDNEISHENKDLQEYGEKGIDFSLDDLSRTDDPVRRYLKEMSGVAVGGGGAV